MSLVKCNSCDTLFESKDHSKPVRGQGLVITCPKCGHSWRKRWLDVGSKDGP